VTQDREDEGCLRLYTLPTPEQADEIRDLLGIRKRMEFSPDELERKRTSMTRALRRKEGKTRVGWTITLPPILDAEPM
jgi:hypothetical protein